MSGQNKPSGWTMARLQEIARINPPIDVALDDQTEVSFVPMSAVEAMSGRLDASQTRTWSDVKRGLTRFQEGDIVAAKITPSMENGKVAVAENLRNGVAAGTTELHVFRPNGAVRAKYLMHYFLQETFRKQARGQMTGTAGQLRVPAAFFEELVLPLPPSAEQVRILEALDSYLSRLDAAVESLTQAQTKLKAYRASVLKAAVEGRLVPTEAELAKAEGRSYEPADKLLERILVERRRAWEERQLADMKAKGKVPRDDKWKAKYEQPAAERETTPKPMGWVWTNISSLIVDGPQNGLYLPKDRYGSGRPILRIDDYQVDWSSASTELQQVSLSEDEAARYSLRLGDIVLNRVNSPSHLGKTMVVEERNLPALFESNMMRFQVSRLVLPRYVNAYLCSIDGKARLTANAKWAVNQASINQRDVADTQVPLPPLSEQQRIVDEMEAQLAVADSAMKQVSGQLTRCARLRQAILKAAFEGRLVDQDPNDEPASELLARLIATPEPAPKTKRGRPPKKTA